MAASRRLPWSMTISALIPAFVGASGTGRKRGRGSLSSRPERSGVLFAGTAGSSGCPVRVGSLLDIDRAAAVAGFHVPMPDGHEEKLVERLKRRDEAAFNELVRLYQGRIFRLVHRMLGNRQEAEDLAQEVFITVFKSIDGFRGESKLSTWLYRVATNHCKNRIKYLQRRGAREEEGVRRDRAAQRDRELHDELDHAPGPPRSGGGGLREGVDPQEGHRRPHRGAAGADRAARHPAPELRRDPGDHGLPEGTVKSRLHRSRHALRKKVKWLSEGRISKPPAKREEEEPPAKVKLKAKSKGKKKGGKE